MPRINANTLNPVSTGVYIDLATSKSRDASLILGRALQTEIFIEEGFNQAKKVKARLTFQSARFVEDIWVPLSLLPSPRIQFRLGNAAGESAFWRGWEDHWITKLVCEPTVMQGFRYIIIETQDWMYAMDQTLKTAVRKGTVSDIVASIMAENDIGSGYTQNGVQGSIVEPTKTPMTMIQSFMTDMDFIMTRLKPRALNTQGMGNFKVYIRENNLVFSTLDYTPTTSKVWTLDYSTSSSYISDVLITDNSRYLYTNGAGGARAVVATPYESRTEHQLYDADKALKLSEVQGSNVESILNIPVTIGDNTNAEAVAMAQNAYAEARQNQYVVTFKIVNTPQLLIGDFIDFVAPENPFAGLYVVSSLKHVILEGAMTTLVSMSRGEVAFERSSTKTYVSPPDSPTVLENQNRAKGQTPRIVQGSTTGNSSRTVPIQAADS